MSAPKKLSDTEFALSNRLAEVDKMLFATRAERDALAARVERLTALVERAYCEGFEYAVALDLDCEWGGGNQWPDSDAKRELAALAETQEGTR